MSELRWGGGGGEDDLDLSFLRWAEGECCAGCHLAATPQLCIWQWSFQTAFTRRCGKHSHLLPLLFLFCFFPLFLIFSVSGHHFSSFHPPLTLFGLLPLSFPTSLSPFDSFTLFFLSSPFLLYSSTFHFLKYSLPLYITSCFSLVLQPPSFLISSGLFLPALPSQCCYSCRQAHFSRPAVPSPLICVYMNPYYWVLETLACSPSSIPDGVPQTFGLKYRTLLTGLKPSLANVALIL